MVSINIRDYFGPHKCPTVALLQSAKNLLAAVNALLNAAIAAGVYLHINPVTSTLVAGEKFGGFRPQDCPIGAQTSAHKQARGVDVYDLGDALDAWLTDEILERYGLYREHPEATAMKPGQVAGWCHLTDRAPGSGNRTFRP